MSYYHPPTYEEGLNSLGIEVLEWVTFGSYQGDYAVILKKENMLGFIVIGYGSCSGCDALEACRSPEEYNQLISAIVKGIYWGTPSELISKINDNFDDNNWYRHDADFNENKAKLIDAVPRSRSKRHR